MVTIVFLLQDRGIPRFTLLMCLGTHKETAESENRVNRGYLVYTKWEENRIEL